MTRWLSRAVVALAVPVLAVPPLTTPAHAAKAPKVPAVAQVAKIYPHLAGGTASTSTSSVKSIKKCKSGKAIKGATSASAAYSPAQYATPTAAAPLVYVSALKFRNTKAAVKYLRSASKATKCPVDVGGTKVKVKVKKLKVRLGDQSWGYTVTATISGQKFVSQSVVARKGKKIITTGVSATDGGTPSAKKAVKLAKLTLKTAR